MATEWNVSTRVERKTTVVFDQAALHTVLRKECGAPADAVVEVESYGDATVTWTVVEYDNGEQS